MVNLLASRTAIPPDIPGTLVALLRPALANLGARDSLVFAIVPFANILGDLDVRGTLRYTWSRAQGIAVSVPRELRGWDA